MNTPTENLINQTEAARLLGIARSTLWRWLKEGHIQAQYTIGGAPVFERSYIQLLAKTHGKSKKDKVA